MPATDHVWRPLGRMHVVFAVSAVALLVSTLWMMERDHADEWREHQTKVDEFRAQKLKRELDKITTGDYQQRLAQLNAAQEQAAADLQQQASELAELQGKVSALQGEVDLLTRETKFEAAKRDVARAEYDLAVRDGKPEQVIATLKQKFDELQQSVESYELQLEQKTAELTQAQQQLAQRTAERDELIEEQNTLLDDEERVEKALAQIDPPDWFSSAKRWLMMQPIVDGFNSPHGIKQDWLPELKQTLGMARVARFDHCRTCHLTIDDFAAGNVPNFPFGPHDPEHGTYGHPYASHPMPDVYLTATSPHPLPSYGCTICHDGDGSGTSFQNAEHTPNDPGEAHLWEEEHDWHSNHFWEYPMQPDRLIESTCIKCHHSVIELGINRQYGPTAPKVYEGYELIKTYGCFGCHEINGYDGDASIGPDLRLEPNYAAAAEQLLQDAVFGSVKDGTALDVPGLIGRADAVIAAAQKPLTRTSDRAALVDEVKTRLQSIDEVSLPVLQQCRSLAEQLADDPAADQARNYLQSLVQSDAQLADLERQFRLRLTPAERAGIPTTPHLNSRSHGLAEALKDSAHPGLMRKVGPSLRHIGSKTTRAFIAYWTERPQRFRPTTRMPQFFNLSNQHDALAQQLQPIQLAGIATFLKEQSQPLELMQPQEGYEPNAERGKRLFSQRGCLACHSHDDEAFKGSTADFGPNLSKVHEKIKPGEEGFHWLYTWLRDPTRYHPRTKMPNLFLQPEGEGDRYIDPAADIAAFLLEGGPREFPRLVEDEAALDRMFQIFVSKTLTKADYETMIQQRAYPHPADQIKGDEIELARRSGDAEPISDKEWQHRKLVYVGRKTISFYGCFGCHDIPGFETARPIGTTLQDWGRKDTSKLALEHIEEFLEHHSDVPERARQATEREIYDGEADEQNLAAAFFYESLLHHGRPGFFWQKLRQPRSYDYMKIETKGYDERLRMPKFPFTEEQIETIATFVLGLVADPPPEDYLFRPDGPKGARIEGERLLDKYNCTGCHMLELPEITYRVNPDDLLESELGPSDYEDALQLLLRLKPPRDGVVGDAASTDGQSSEKIVSFRGLVFGEPDYEDDPEYQEFSYDLWETLDVGKKRLFPGSKMLVPVQKIMEQKPARGGDFAQWLVPRLMEQSPDTNRFLAWQASPPPLYKEGVKVQTPWLYQFLKNPHRIRYTTVLRMPRFNMSDDEAMSLANYFAAVDGVPYPYQPLRPQQPSYLDAKQAQFRAEFSGAEGDYLETAWKLLNAPLCSKCHSVAGREYQSTDPSKDIRGPNLDQVEKRLQPAWMQLWLYKPAWITPYTSMPMVFPKNQQQMPELFGGDGEAQTIATRDALMNYYRLMEAHGPIASEQAGDQPPPQTGAGGE